MVVMEPDGPCDEDRLTPSANPIQSNPHPQRPRAGALRDRSILPARPFDTNRELRHRQVGSAPGPELVLALCTRQVYQARILRAEALVISPSPGMSDRLGSWVSVGTDCIRRAWRCAALTMAVGVVWVLFSGIRTADGNHDFLARWSYSCAYGLGHPWATSAAGKERSPTNRDARPEAVLVLVDDGATEATRYYFQRTNYAALLHRLAGVSPRLVCFDLVFLEKHPELDQNFAQALREMGRVVIGGSVGRRFTTDSGLMPTEAAALREAGVRVGRIRYPPGAPYDTGIPWGLTDLRIDADDTVRALDTWNGHLDAGHSDNRTLAWRAAVVAGAPLAETDLIRPRWIRYYRPTETESIGARTRFEKVPFVQALGCDDATFRRMFEDRYVFVGIERGLHPAGNSIADTFVHPWTGRRFSGVELQATATMNLIRGDWLGYVPVPGQLLTVLAWGALASLLLTWNRSPSMQIAVAGLAIAVAVVSVLAQIRPESLGLERGLWWPWMIVVGLQAPVALTTSAWIPSWRETRRMVFISYRISDGEVHARSLQSALEKVGIQAFMDQGSILGGVDYPPLLERAVRRCPNLLLVLTQDVRRTLAPDRSAPSPGLPEAVNERPRPWVVREVQLAQRVGNKLVMVEPSTLSKEANPWLLAASDFRDLRILVGELRAPSEGASRKLAMFLRSALPDSLRHAVDRLHPDDVVPGEVQDEVLLTLGTVLRHGSLSAEGRCGELRLRHRTQALLARNPRGDLLVRLNRWLLEDAFPRALWPSSFDDFQEDDLREDLGFLVTSQRCTFATNENHENSLARLVETLALPRRTRREVNRVLTERSRRQVVERQTS